MTGIYGACEPESFELSWNDRFILTKGLAEYGQWRADSERYLLRHCVEVYLADGDIDNLDAMLSISGALVKPIAELFDRINPPNLRQPGDDPESEPTYSREPWFWITFQEDTAKARELAIKEREEILADLHSLCDTVTEPEQKG